VQHKEKKNAHTNIKLKIKND